MPKQSDMQLDQEIEKMQSSISLCRKVAEVVEMPGWKDIIEPLLDKMIMDIVGSKVNGRWYGGLIDRAKKDERREFYVGYKQALIDLHTRILAYVANVKISEVRVANLIKEKDTVRFTVPMVDDTRYGANDGLQKR
jgi:hypothetical protein